MANGRSARERTLATMREREAKDCGEIATKREGQRSGETAGQTLRRGNYEMANTNKMQIGVHAKEKRCYYARTLKTPYVPIWPKTFAC